MDVIWILLAGAAGLMGAAAGLYAGSWFLRRTVRELQYGLADLEDRLVREVKKRAAAARWEGEPDPAELKEELKAAAGGFLSPAEFARRKSARRLRGTEARQDLGEGS